MHPSVNLRKRWMEPPLVSCMVGLVALVAWLALRQPMTANAQSSTTSGQSLITTYAGGGPNHLPGAASNLGFPAAVAFDSKGNLYIADRAELVDRVFKVDPSGQLTVLAGVGGTGLTINYAGDGGPATEAHLFGPGGVAADAGGNVFIADPGNHVVRRVDALTGIITTYAGNGTSGYSGDGGLATNAQLVGPTAVVVDAGGNLFIADSFIRRVDAATQIITTYAGTSGTTVCAAATDSLGDGCPAMQAFAGAIGLAFDPSGNLFFSDASNVVRRIDASTQIVTLVAGNGVAGYTGDGGPAISAQLNGPEQIAFDASANLFIADTQNMVIRRVDASTKVISTYAGATRPIICAGATDSLGDGCLATNAELSRPEGVTVDAAGNLVIADTNDGLIRKVDAATQIITASVGIVSPLANPREFSGEGVPATDASLSQDDYLSALDGKGNLYIADVDNFRVRRVDAVTGTITTVAGNGVPCRATTPAQCGDGGPATSAQLYNPVAVAADPSGNVFIADSAFIRRVAGGIITTYAGNGTPCSGTLVGTCGDGGLAINASISASSLVFDSLGNLFFADPSHERVRRIDAVTGGISTVAGGGTASCVSGSVSPSNCGDGGPATSAVLQGPVGVALDGSGNLFVSENNGNRVRRVDHITQIISTYAGNIGGSGGYSGDGGLATSALLAAPYGLAFDSLNNLFIADSVNFVIRRVDVNTQIITTVAGNKTLNTHGDFSGDGGPPLNAKFNFLDGVAADSAGNLFITDSWNGRIRRVGLVALGTFSAAALDFKSITVGSTSATQTVTLTNTGTAPLDISSVAVAGENSTDFFESNTCGPFPATLAPAANCAINFSFTPGAAGPRTASLTVTDNDSGLNGNTQTVSLVGVGTVPPGGSASSVALTSSSNPSVFGQQVTFTATVSSSAPGTPGGTVTFLDGSTTLGTATLASGTATFSSSALTASTHSITASYGGDSNFAVSTSPAFTQTVNQAATTTSLTASPNPSNSGQSVTLTATVTAVAPGAGAPSGTVTFLDGTTTLGTGTLNSAGTAAFSTSSLSSGSHSLTASYGGDVNFTASTSTVVSQMVSVLIAVNESITVSDSPALLPSAMINVPESISVSDIPILLPSAMINVPESITVTDALVVLPPAVISVTETITVTDSPSVGNTPAGTNVSVTPIDTTSGAAPVNVTYGSVTQPGITSLITSGTGAVPPAGFQLGSPAVYYDISTSATFTGSATVCINYSGITFSGTQPPQLFHLENGVWVNRTTSVDTTNKIVCGSVSSFSPFAIFQQIILPPVANAGPASRTVECCSPNGTQVALDGSASTDPNGETLTYQWSDQNNNVIGTTAKITVTDPLGTFTYTLKVTNTTGLSSTAQTQISIVDTTPPSLTLSTTTMTVTLPTVTAMGAAVSLAGVAAVTDACDSNSTLTNNAPVVFPIGKTLVTFTASDHSGNTSQKQLTVQVVYNFSGYFTPLLSNGSAYFHTGRTVPVKFQLTAADGTIVPNAIANIQVSLIQNTPSGTVDEDVATTASGSSNTGTLFRFDTTSGQYIYNLDTTGYVTGTYLARTTINDGTTHDVQFSIQ